jgi:hypothetical protein
MGYLCIASLACVQSIRASAPQIQPETPQPLITVWEGTTDLSPHGASAHTCVFVLPDGHLHLEKRSQRLRDRTATMRTFDYSLDTAQLAELRRLLDDEEMRHLPTYTQPTLPMGTTRSHGLNAKIARSTGGQSVGYWTWNGGGPSTSPNSMPESTKEAWKQSEAKLRPLTDWLRSIERLNLTLSNSLSPLCGMDPEAGAP